MAYAYAFSRAAEAALELAVPDRAVWLRALLAELERLANHLGDIGAICNDASFALMHANCSMLRESVLRAADTRLRPSPDAGHHRARRRGASTSTADGDGSDPGDARQYRRALSRHWSNSTTTPLRCRIAPSIPACSSPHWPGNIGAGGYIGRASGRPFDARRTFAYPPYDRLRFEVPVLNEGDVNARVWIRVREVEQSLSLIDQILDRLPRRSDVPRL